MMEDGVVHTFMRNAGRQQTQFYVGVLQPYEISIQPVRNKKLIPKFNGPYQLTPVVGNDRYTQ